MREANRTKEEESNWFPAWVLTDVLISAGGGEDGENALKQFSLLWKV